MNSWKSMVRSREWKQIIHLSLIFEESDNYHSIYYCIVLCSFSFSCHRLQIVLVKSANNQMFVKLSIRLIEFFSDKMLYLAGFSRSTVNHAHINRRLNHHTVIMHARKKKHLILYSVRARSSVFVPYRKMMRSTVNYGRKSMNQSIKRNTS